MKSELVDIPCRIIGETEEAILIMDGSFESVHTDDGGFYDRPKKTWLPRSQVEIEFAADGGGYIVTMPESLALDKGLV